MLSSLGAGGYFRKWERVSFVFVFGQTDTQPGFWSAQQFMNFFGEKNNLEEMSWTLLEYLSFKTQMSLDMYSTSKTEL